MSASFSVSGKTAIVTGAGSGICLAFAELLLSRNCNVVLADLSLRPEAQELVDKYAAKDAGPRALFVKTDVRSWPDLSNLFDATLREFGDYDIVCPGAGVYEPHWSSFWHPPGSAEARDSPDGGRYAELDINLTHPIRATQMALSQWLNPRTDTGAGADSQQRAPPAKASPDTNPKRVIHIASVAAQIPVFRSPIYCATKFAISGFVRSLARLDGRLGVRVNAVAPGVVRTPLWTDHPEKLHNVDEADGWVTPQECAEAMLRCMEAQDVPGGSVLEVGRDNTRLVDWRNDPGPDMDPKKGLATRNNDYGDDMVWDWLKDEKIWGV